MSANMSANMSAANEDVLARIEGALGHLTLNRPRALNALTLDMVRSLATTLEEWATDPAVKLVLIDGAGDRGLCAGGDIRSLYDAALANTLDLPKQFFREEYRLNAQIAAYPKPYVAFMDGIVMGGGIGVSAHGSLRIVTERSRLAMPETGIGFVVDVGGTWLLARAPDQFGTHAALTSMQLGPADALLCGLADHHVPFGSLPAFAAALANCATPADIRAAVAAHATVPAPGALALARPWISTCYAHDTVEQILAALAAHPDPAAQKAAQDIASKSPTSLKVTLRALRTAPALGSLQAALGQEYRLVLHSVQTPDFREGVRAAVVDKDRNPKWSPPTLAEVTPAGIDAFFTAPDYGGLGLIPPT
jgi:enoyl-CoA hydratase